MDTLERAPSFKQIDYRLRLNKGTERKMLVELFRRLVFFEPVQNYRYIGFGATTFSDFILFHKELNISDMISIEIHQEYEKRCKFNKPFDCITIISGDSNEVLPQLSWEKRTIAWLDYDGRLTDTVKQDISYVVSRLKSGSMFIVTVNAGGYSTYPKEKVEKATRRLRSLFEKDAKFKLPSIYEAKHLQGIDMAKTCRKLIEDIIRISLRDRNGLSSLDNTIQYYPLTCFVYQDGAQMLTVGGLFFESKDEKIVEKCQFDNLGFTTPLAGELYEIKIPIITPRERHYLDQKLPLGTYLDAKAEFGLTQDEIDNYVCLYRYCPSYAEVGLI